MKERLRATARVAPTATIDNEPVGGGALDAPCAAKCYPLECHCEEHSDVAISFWTCAKTLVEIATSGLTPLLAMTVVNEKTAPREGAVCSFFEAF